MEARITAAENWATIVSRDGPGSSSYVGDWNINEHLINQAADLKGPLILDNLRHDPTAYIPQETTLQTPIDTVPFEQWQDQFRYSNRFSDGYALFVRNTGDLVLKQVNFSTALDISGQHPGVYIETVAPPTTQLTASAAAVQPQLQLASATAFALGDSVLLSSAGTALRGTIVAIDYQANTVTLDQPLATELMAGSTIRKTADLTVTGHSLLSSSQVNRDPGIVLIGGDQLHLGDSSVTSPLQADALAGQTFIEVADGSLFRMHDYLLITDGQANVFKTTVMGVSGNTLQLLDALPIGFTTAGGAQASLGGTIELITPLNQPQLKTQQVNTLELNASAYHGGLGGVPVTSRYVLTEKQAVSENVESHVQRRVRMEYGSDGESGFLTIIHFADNAFQVFDEAGQVARLQAGSEFALQPLTSDAQAILNTTEDVGLFARDGNQNFAPEFLFNNKDLQTEVVIRRSLDFFLYSNGSATSAAEVIDHTAYFQEILNVQTLGQPSMGAIVPIPEALIPATPVIPLFAVDVEPPNLLPLPPIELPTIHAEVIEVAIFRVPVHDANGDGQVDANELPAFDEVLDSLEESPEYQETKITIESRNAGQAPTQGEIEEQKEKLKRKPNLPSGAYAIIRKSADGKQEVLEVFAIRDWPEASEPSESAPEALDELPSLQLPPADEGSEAADMPTPTGSAESEGEGQGPAPHVPPDDQTGYRWPARPAPTTDVSATSDTRFAPSGLLLGTLWMLRTARTSAPDQAAGEPAQPVAWTGKDTSAADGHRPPIDLGRRARWSRRLRKHVQNMTDR